MDHLLLFNVSLYEEAPCGLENLFRCINWTLKRLQLFDILKTHEMITADVLRQELGENSLKHLLGVTKTPEVQKARYIDYITHWILRIVYCDKYPSFFIKNELIWFKLRFNNMTLEEKRNFWAKYKLTEATDEEKSPMELAEGKWYKIPFIQVTSLLKLRLYPMFRGYIFVPEHEIVYWLADKLEKSLNLDMEHCKRMLPSMDPQLEILVNSYELVKPPEFCSSGTLRLENLESSVTNFPLCMKHQHETLRRNHHLKHFSRQQYGLFLKGVGLPLDQTLQLFEEEFTHKITERQFKKLDYYFRHLYGTVGSKINYQPQTCDNILEQMPGPQDVNGCPFKQWDASFLIDRLRKDHVSESNIEEIVALKSEGKYKTACGMYLECVHKCTGVTVQHPVDYYSKACAAEVDIEDLDWLFQDDD